MKINKYLILTILWMGIIFFFSSQDAGASSMNDSFIIEFLCRLGINLMELLPGVDINFIIRKAAHFTEYFILGVLLYKTYKGYLYNRQEIFSIATGFLYACSDEIHQYFVPGRGPAFSDVLIDTSGVILGVIVLWLIGVRNVKELQYNKKSA